MKHLLAIIALILVLSAIALPVNLFTSSPALAAFEDPFTCDPYRFPFDFPLKCDSPYDSIQYTLLVRSASKLDQAITISMWPNYTTQPKTAESDWFIITPSTGNPLPSGSVAAFTIVCKPPLCELGDATYSTYLKIATQMSNGYYWERPLTVVVRSGTDVPVVDYTLGQGFRICEITGNEATKYTQDQVTILVNNRANTPNEFKLLPMTPNPPSETLPANAAGDFKKLQDLWRDPTALSVYCEPLPSTWNASIAGYTEYRLYTLDSDNNQLEFGAFLGATYSRPTDSAPTLCYPYQIAARKSADIPFTLRVNRTVPTGIYRLQVWIRPCGISTAGRPDGASSIGTEYACKIPVVVTRTGGTITHTSASLPYILIGASGFLILGFGCLLYPSLKRRLRKQKHSRTPTPPTPTTNGKGRRYST